MQANGDTQWGMSGEDAGKDADIRTLERERERSCGVETVHPALVREREKKLWS